MVTHHNAAIQDRFLKELCDQKIPISVFLVNGIKLHGVMDCFDSHVIMLKNSVTQMVYKHAISTVVPSRSISLGSGDTEESMSD